jgi:site-specific DNA recombinase
MKKAIRYLRFSSDGQSASSIEWQEMYTAQWCERKQITILDTFIDAGYSAKTFDRPDMDKLTEFIRKYYRDIDYLVVNQMDRFSRDAGEALSVMKKLQRKYNVQIASVMEGFIFDYSDPGSFFYGGLLLLKAEDENIRRTNNINGGIYAAKAKEGRYIHKPPIGYIREGKNKNAVLIIEEEKAKIVRYMFDAYLRNTPIYLILKTARSMGFTHTAKEAVQYVLRNPLYAGFLQVKAYREMPGGLFPGKHEPIIDSISWQQVQDKLTGKPKTKVSLKDEIPLRGVLKCHCSRYLTGAPSRGRHGNYFYYYKCNTTGHNNISAIKAHDQLLNALDLMSIPDYLIDAIKAKSLELMNVHLQENKQLLLKKKIELEKADKQLASVEEKWINEQMTFETYNRWYANLTQQRVHLRTAIDKLSQDQNQVYVLLDKNLHRLADLKQVYVSANTLQKQELIRMVFDNRLYYRDKIYRTPYIMPVFAHNTLILKEKKLLIYEQKRENLSFPCEVELTGLEPVSKHIYH